MKTLNTLLSAILALLFLTGCEEGLTLDVKTKLTQKITADISNNLKSTVNNDSIAFYVSDTLNIKNNAEIEKNLEKIKEMAITQISCKLNGIPENELIHELSIEIPEAGITLLLNNLSENNTNFDLTVSDDLLQLTANYLFQNHTITTILRGYSSYAPMILTVELTYETTLTTSI
ncbi:MAG: hypothetical protein AB7S69_03290 [Salinivirgaceae bacterium]|jgi:hypothetical protein